MDPSALTIQEPSAWLGRRSIRIGKGWPRSSFSAIDTVSGEPRPMRSMRSLSIGGSIRPAITIGCWGTAAALLLGLPAVGPEARGADGLQASKVRTASRVGKNRKGAVTIHYTRGRTQT